MSSAVRPLVSVITPTYNRRAFIPRLLRYFAYQTYPAELMELVILDDGSDKVGDLVPPDDRRIRYVAVTERANVGVKRNVCAELARGEIVVCMDDDDWYPPDRVASCVERLQRASADVVGKSELHFYDTQTERIHVYPHSSERHACAASMAFRKSYWRRRPFAETRVAEERPILDDLTSHMVQLDQASWRVMLCINHGTNTYRKDTSRPVTSLTLEHVIADDTDRGFYKRLGRNGR
jgi:glycosyltransferase involved in cell wall biosynthesis